MCESQFYVCGEDDCGLNFSYVFSARSGISREKIDASLAHMFRFLPCCSDAGIRQLRVCVWGDCILNPVVDAVKTGGFL